MSFRFRLRIALLVVVTTALSWSATLHANDIRPIEGNTGQYMSPITSDGVVAEWVNRSINANMGATAGSAVGAYAGSRAMSSIPFVGGMIGSQVGQSAGRAAALQAAGGEALIRSTSDLSFNSLNTMAQWLAINHSSRADFADILKATQAVYPELASIYPAAAAQAQAREQQRLTAGRVGFTLDSSGGAIRINAIAPDSPNRNIGVEPGDVLISVDGQFIQGATIAQVSQRLRGPVDTTVDIAVVREGEQELRSYTLTRAVIADPVPPPTQQTFAPAAQPSQPVARVPYTDREFYGSLFLAVTSDEIDGVGLGGDLGYFGVSPGGFDGYVKGELVYTDDGFDIEYFALRMDLGATYSIDNAWSFYGALILSAADVENDDFSEDYTGFGYRLGTRYAVKSSNLFIDLSYQSTRLEGTFEDKITQSGLRFELELGITESVGLLMSYEDLDFGNAILIGVRFRGH
ncbi:MAG: PDZ domain-containing protein [Marinobacter sp.]|nr:PDZ domain-containing protein [Marinobacter sp.]